MRDHRSHIAAILLSAPLAACGADPATAPDPARSASVPAAVAAPVQEGRASYYAPSLAGEETASGKPLDPNDMTAASRTLPLGTEAKVTNKENGRSVHVEITDRGPYARNRILDVTPKAAARLGMKDDGVAPVEVRPLEPAQRTDGPR